MPRKQESVLLVFISTTILFYNLIGFETQRPAVQVGQEGMGGQEAKVDNTLKIRAGRVAAECASFSKLRNVSSPGREVVLLPGIPPIQVCIPHKVGSHAWGVFARHLLHLYPQRLEAIQQLNWKERADKVVRAIIVRHPLDRLVSAYRMIFQNWCNPESFIRKTWPTSCSGKSLQENQAEPSPLERAVLTGGEGVSLLAAVWDEYLHGQDRYIARVWKKFHNTSDKTAPFQFRFPEFVRLVVNGSREFAGDEYMSQVIRFFSPPTYLAYLLHISYLSFSSHISRSTPLQHRLISSHWAAYHEECPPCSQFTSPHLVLTMENLQEELPQLLAIGGLAEHAGLFPHTHKQAGGDSASLTASFLEQLSQEELQQVKEAFKVDMQLFGFT